MGDYFLGIMLPEDFAKEVESWRRRFSAPHTAPHITLIPPFTWSGSDEDLVQTVSPVLIHTVPFVVNAKGLGSFGRSVIYINVDLAPELEVLHHNLQESLVAEGITSLLGSRAYHPHITLATRLSPERYRAYKAELAGYIPEREFLCQEIVLFRMQTRGRMHRWLVHKRLSLSCSDYY